MGLFVKAELCVRINEEVGFARPILYNVQVKGGEFGRFFWRQMPNTTAMTASEAMLVAKQYSTKTGARLC